MKGTGSGNTPTPVGWIAAVMVGALAFALVRYQFFFVLPSAAAIGLAATLAMILLLSAPGEGPEVQDTRVRKIVPQHEKPLTEVPRQVMPTRVARVEPIRAFDPTPAPVAPEPMAPAEPVGFVLAPPAAAELAPRRKSAAKPADVPPITAPVATAKSAQATSLERLATPRNGRADDLKALDGIGPALEKLLHGLGIFHFDQIAAWTDADVAAVDAEMKNFKGRIVRDAWVAQAQAIVTRGLPTLRDDAPDEGV